jgi:Zn-finger nucleic acid-binding protein
MLTQTQVEGAEVDACPSCGGLWFDAGELLRLAGGRSGTLGALERRHSPDPLADAPASTLRSRLCPECQTPLAEFEYPWAPGIRLDGCTQCRGVWVDESELGRIEAFVVRERSRQAAAPAAPRSPRAPAPSPAAPSPPSRVDLEKQILGRMQAAEDFFKRLRGE